MLRHHLNIGFAVWDLSEVLQRGVAPGTESRQPPKPHLLLARQQDLVSRSGGSELEGHKC